MNLFNRLIIILSALALMTISLLLLSQVLNIATPNFAGSPLWLTEQIVSLSDSELHTRLAYGGICLIVLLTGAVLVYLELRPLFLNEKKLLVLRDELGKVELSKTCVQKYIDLEARLFSEISKTSSRVVEKKDGLHIVSSIVVKPESKIGELGLIFRNQIKRRLESNLGILISTIEVTVKFNEGPVRPKSSLV